jgi:peptide-methionine (S)-S-oxide reductase
MLKSIQKIAFGGGCHWCTEAVFQSIIGVEKVEQGYVASTGEHSGFSEAVILHFNPEIVPLKRIIEIHLYTHKSTSNHSMRQKYRSAVYAYSASQLESSKDIIDRFQPDFNFKIITQVYPFKSFKTSRDELLNYYKNDPEKPFCKTFIDPKLKLLLEQFSENIDPNIKGS